MLADGLPGPPPTPSRRDSDHHREVQQLYEEMEQQIRQEKQQLQAEVGSLAACPSPASPAAGLVPGQCGAAEGCWEWILSLP